MEANGMELLPRGRYFFHVAFIRSEYVWQIIILFGGRRFGGKRYQYHLHTLTTVVGRNVGDLKVLKS